MKVRNADLLSLRILQTQQTGAMQALSNVADVLIALTQYRRRYIHPA
jgi:hypothetical protein